MPGRRITRLAVVAAGVATILGGSVSRAAGASPPRAVPAAPAAQQPAASGVRVEVGVDPRVVRVGEPFRAAVRIVAPDGQTAGIGPFVPNDSLGAAGDPEIGRDDTGAATAIFPLVAWIAGAPLAAVVPVRVAAADGSIRTIEIALRLPEVISILPAAGDAAEIVPRPPRGVIPLSVPGSSGWPWLFLLAALAVLAALLIWWVRRRPAPLPVPAPGADPREWALAQLGPDGAGGLLASRDLSALATHVSRVVRSYVGRVRPALSEDLTTTEVVDRVGGTIPGAGVAAELLAILGLADRVKFARHRISFEEAEWLLAEARSWVSRYPLSGMEAREGSGGSGPDGSGPGGGGRRDAAPASDAGGGPTTDSGGRPDDGASGSRRAA